PASPPTREWEGVPQTAHRNGATVEPSDPIREGNAMTIIWAIIIGFLVGIVAKFLMPGRDPGGFIVTALLGIVGALVATFLGQAMGIYAAGQSAGFIGAVIGAIIVLFVYHMIRGRRRVV
ncbi:MAG: GlsB/YeaQ/YmgE family stress response membrane protein, partial [Usitatibacter sp.]